MSKIIKLYHIFSRNALGLLLLATLFVKPLLAEDKKPKNSKIRTIIIDPGHGGKDSGTMGTKRYTQYEKHIALDISLKLGNYIKEAFPNIEIIYTRKTDVFLELWERTELANNKNADLFISVHCDGFTNPKPSGASVFVMGMSKLKANMDVAMRENSVMYLEDDFKEKYDGFDPKSPESYIVFSLMQNTFLDQSISIAGKIEDEFANRAKRKSRGVKQAPFYVISRVNMPSILIEAGFLTNPKEEDFLNTELGKDHIASAIFRGFRSYKESVDGANVKELDKPEIKEKEIIKISTPKKEIPTDKVVFKVQIGTYLKSMLNEGSFKEINAEEQVLNGTFKYFVGNELDKIVADNLKLKMKEKGFKGAFVVAFFKGKRISTKEALSLQSKNISHE
ncbi:N-acetylmuramoyl-L-alanine amidase [Flavobacteriales bacterium]|nr:N-acetylmuramoyl-L-alanine amidase [Flavobacteriales bacterium]MDG1348977.1 N-acetylmuramoyl-L-alanine amidase [Flavobacteriales bacterium]